MQISLGHMPGYRRHKKTKSTTQHLFGLGLKANCPGGSDDRLVSDRKALYRLGIHEHSRIAS